MQFAGKIKALFLHFFEWRYEMRIAYVRVSTEEQNEARQREALKQYRIEKWFCEKRSAKDTNRPQLEAMLEFARSGDTIYIHDFSRLARNKSVQRGLLISATLVSSRNDPPVKYFVSSFREELFISAAARTWVRSLV